MKNDMKNFRKSALETSAVGKLRLPHPYYTTYFAIAEDGDSKQQILRLAMDDSGPTDSQALPENLHNENISYRPLQAASGNLPPDSNNSAWARARRAPSTSISWEDAVSPTLGQIWLIVYAIFTQFPQTEIFRLTLQGSGPGIRESLLASTLAISHPAPEKSRPGDSPELGRSELLILRSTFWQGAGSPIGSSSAWIPEGGQSSNTTTMTQMITTGFPEGRVHTLHPRRATKPRPGSVFYSRYIPSLDEHFNMIALDYTNPEHLNMFHNWQNDPRVAKGWNETGDLEHHRNYLRNLHDDPHVLTVLARFEDVFFAYYEIYWAKVRAIPG